MQHKGIFTFAFQRINQLSIAHGTQSSRDQRLSFSTSEQRSTVSFSQHTNFHIDGTNGRAITAIDTWFTTGNTATNNFLF